MNDDLEATLRRIREAEEQRDMHIRGALRWTWEAHRHREALRRQLAQGPQSPE